MSYKDKFKQSEEKPIYTRPSQLTEMVAFEVVRAARIANKTSGKKSNVMFLKFKPGLVLQFYGDKDYQEFDEDEVLEFSNDINKGDKYYVVSYGMISDFVVTKTLPHESIVKLGIPIFDADLHVLIEDSGTKRSFDNVPSTSGFSGLKRTKTD